MAWVDGNQWFFLLGAYNVQRCGFMCDENKYAIPDSYGWGEDRFNDRGTEQVDQGLWRNNIEHFSQQILFWDFLDVIGGKLVGYPPEVRSAVILHLHLHLCI